MEKTEETDDIAVDKVVDKSHSPLEKIDILNEGEFVANGKKYFLEPEISIERYKMMNKLELEIGYSTTFKKHYKGLNDLYALLNNMKLVDASIKLRDVMESMNRMDDQNNHHPILKYCTLILNTKDEDRRAVDEKVMAEKIEDWEKSGIPISCFFVVVLHSVNGLLESYKEIIQKTFQNQNHELKKN